MDQFVANAHANSGQMLTKERHSIKELIEMIAHQVVTVNDGMRQIEHNIHQPLDVEVPGQQPVEGKPGLRIMLESMAQSLRDTQNRADRVLDIIS